MAKKLNAQDRACRLKALLVDLGRAHSLRDPLAELAKDLTPPQMHSLLWLHEEGALPITVLAHRVHCAGPTITGVVDRLERLGLVARKRDVEDRRVVHVELTAAGKKIADKMDRAMIGQLSLLFTALSATDGDALLKIATRLVDAVRAAPPIGGHKKHAETEAP